MILSLLIKHKEIYETEIWRKKIELDGLKELLEETSDNENWEQSFLEENPDIDDIEFLIRCKMREYKCDYEDAKMFVETELEEMDELVKMTSKEQLAFLKQKDLDETSYERKENYAKKISNILLWFLVFVFFWNFYFF